MGYFLRDYLMRDMVAREKAIRKTETLQSWHRVEMTVARQPDLLESRFGPLGYSEAVHCDARRRWPDTEC
jgi:hypothetical protein